MSYGVSAALQAAVFERLAGDPTLTALVGPAIFDAVPQGTLPPIYVTLGPERVTDLSDKTGRGAQHELTVSVITDQAGFALAKEAAGAVSDALVDAALALTRGRLVRMQFHKASASRIGGGAERQIDVIFRAVVEDD